jgi:hypothetical protein
MKKLETKIKEANWTARMFDILENAICNGLTVQFLSVKYGIGIPQVHQIVAQGFKKVTFFMNHETTKEQKKQLEKLYDAVLYDSNDYICFTIFTLDEARHHPEQFRHLVNAARVRAVSTAFQKRLYEEKMTKRPWDYEDDPRDVPNYATTISLAEMLSYGDKELVGSILEDLVSLK